MKSKEIQPCHPHLCETAHFNRITFYFIQLTLRASGTNRQLLSKGDLIGTVKCSNKDKMHR